MPEKQEGQAASTTWPLGRKSPRMNTGARTYLVVLPGGGGATSLCCAQAPSPKAVTTTATIMIVFNSFNLSRLLSQQVAPGLFRQGKIRKQCFSSPFWISTDCTPGYFP